MQWHTVMRWQTVDGRVLETDEISNDHLKNIVRHCRKYQYHPIVTEYFEGEVDRRQLGEVSGDPVPWVDPRDGLRKAYAPEVTPYDYTVVGPCDWCSSYDFSCTGLCKP